MFNAVGVRNNDPEIFEIIEEVRYISVKMKTDTGLYKGIRLYNVDNDTLVDENWSGLRDKWTPLQAIPSD